MSIEAAPLRDTISAAFDSVTADEATPAPAPEPAAPAAEPALASPAAEAPAQPKEDATGRLHAADGKFASKQPAQPQAPAPAPLPERKRPTTWKKEMWDAYDKLDPQLADYILQREQEYTRGVSTYAQEWQRAKPLMEAIAPFNEILKQHNIEPAKHVGALLAAHQQLVLGSPEAKLAMFARLAQDYQVPLGNLLQQGQDGQWYLNQPQMPAPQPGIRPEDIDARVKAALEQQKIDSEIAAFPAAHPHYEAVRETMARLLDAGIANGLEDAYARALRMPEYESLAGPKPDQQEAARKQAQVARRNAVSTPSATPVAGASPAGQSLRGMIESAFDQHAAGRV